MKNKIECLRKQLGIEIQKNQEREAQAVQGYTEQLEAISRLREVLLLEDDSKEELSFLEDLEADTVEKIEDELNHEHGLLAEYSQLMGIEIKES